MTLLERREHMHPDRKTKVGAELYVGRGEAVLSCPSTTSTQQPYLYITAH